MYEVTLLLLVYVTSSSIYDIYWSDRGERDRRLAGPDAARRGGAARNIYYE